MRPRLLPLVLALDLGVPRFCYLVVNDGPKRVAPRFRVDDSLFQSGRRPIFRRLPQDNRLLVLEMLGDRKRLLEERRVFILGVARVVDVEWLRDGTDGLLHGGDRADRALVAICPQALGELQPLLNFSDVVATVCPLIDIRIVLPRLLRLHLRGSRHSALSLPIFRPTCTCYFTRFLI